METEIHPLKPFLPKKPKVLLLGSFPPKQQRWSMPFYYPNFQNDMWRIMGWLFFDDKNHFVRLEERRFDYESVKAFCESKGIAIFDTASEIIRLNDNASDKFLQIVKATDINALLAELPECNFIATTGQKAAETLAASFACAVPKVGSCNDIFIANRNVHFYRMPSSSRAYPLALEKKADYYKILFQEIGLL